MKKILGILVVIMIISIVFNTFSVFAFGGGFQQNILKNYSSGTLPGKTAVFKQPIMRIANTIFLILQIASIAGVILLGIKYMYMSSDKRAEVKNGLIMVVIGLVLVFGASTVAQFVTKVFNEVT